MLGPGTARPAGADAGRSQGREAPLRPKWPISPEGRPALRTLHTSRETLETAQ